MCRGIWGEDPASVEGTLLLSFGLVFDLVFFSFAGRLAGPGSNSSPEAGPGDRAGLGSSEELLFRSFPVFLTAFPASESAASSRSIVTLLGTA